MRQIQHFSRIKFILLAHTVFKMKKNLSSIIRHANTTLLVNGELDSVDEFFTQNYTVHLTGRILEGGHPLVKRILGKLRNSFADIQVDVDILLEGEERVAWQRVIRGTHQSPFKGFPASGLQIIWRDMVTSHFYNGLISEEWVLTDLAEQLLLARKRKS